MKFGFLLKELRLLKGATQQIIADKLNIERSTYSKWEADKVTIRVDQLKNIANIYGLDFEYVGRCIEAQRLVSKIDAQRFILMQEHKENSLGKISSRY